MRTLLNDHHILQLLNCLKIIKNLKILRENCLEAQTVLQIDSRVEIYYIFSEIGTFCLIRSANTKTPKIPTVSYLQSIF